MAPLTLSLDAAGATLGSCGGKGVNLVRLIGAGFRIPPGFVVATDAYRGFVAANDVSAVLEGAVAGVDPGDAAALESASGTIRGAFSAGTVPVEVVNAVRSAWAEAFSPGAALAVRSSATAEDLPDLSFAGQQDTFLNVVGFESLMRAVVECWSSLWTARAISYRMRNLIPHEGVALAVVVQQLIASEVSGVLFTANPLTGTRTETVIDATAGLGEALVSGHVEPDHFVVDAATGWIINRSVGAKAVATVSRTGGGVVTLSQEGSAQLSLTDAQVAELVELGQEVQAEYGSPQDIEWAIAEGTVFLLQSRAITSLFPLPEGDDPQAVWFSFAAVQGTLQPITPLGRDAIRLMLSGATTLFGPGADLGEAGYLRPAGERLWIRLDKALRHPLGARILPRVFPLLDPGSAVVIADLVKDPRWASHSSRPSAASLRGLAKGFATIAPRVPRVLIDPERQRRMLEALVVRMVKEASVGQEQAAAVADPGSRLAARVQAMTTALGRALPTLLPTFAPIMGPSVFMMHRLSILTDGAGGAGDQARALVMEALRGLPGNVTTEMDLALWTVAVTIQADPTSLGLFRDTDAQGLVDLFVAGALPASAQGAVSSFVGRYGMRGVSEIDLGQPRWRENPIDIIRSLQSYVEITDPAQAPDVVFARGQVAASEATARLARLLAAQQHAPTALSPRAQRARFMISRMRGMLGARETPKFTLIRLLGLIREGLLGSGQDLVDAGVLGEADDIFFLHVDELDEVWSQPGEHWQSLVANRRQVAERERQRRQIPRLMVGNGRTYYEGLGSTAEGGITGSPVSPGVVEGRVRVVLDPQTTHLSPGEILVCPGTDPAWTPLFLVAGGLVTEVGGMMTHGSVVAREYGIPAVVGVHEATTRLSTGQRIRLDGTCGTIDLLDEEPAGHPGTADTDSLTG